jgi:serine/threonine protein kinase
MAQPIARWLELHAQLGAIDTRNYAAQLSARYSCDDLRFCVERDFLDCGLDDVHAKRAAAAAAAQRGDSDSARGPRPRAPTPEPVLSDGESLSPGKSDDVRVTLRDATGNATACDVSLKQLRRALQSFDGQARVGGERGTLSIEVIHRRPADVITSMAAMDVSSVPRGSPADVALGSLDADVSRWRPADVARWLRGIEALSSYSMSPSTPRVDGRQLLRVRSRDDVARVLGVSLAVHQRLLLRELDALRAAFPEELQPVRTRRPVGRVVQRGQRRALRAPGRVQPDAELPPLSTPERRRRGEEKPVEEVREEGKGVKRRPIWSRDGEKARQRCEDNVEARMASLTPPAATQSLKQTPEARLLVAGNLQMDLAAVDRDARDAGEESYDFSEGGTLIDWRRGLAINTIQDGENRPRGASIVDGPMPSSVTSIAPSDLIVLGELGRGACASVRRALHAPTLTLVAVKMVAVHDDARRRQLLRELAALHQLSTVPLTDDARQRALSQDGAMGGRDSEDFSAHRDSRSQKALRAHIVAFHGAFTNPQAGCVCAVLEYMDARSVHDVMEARGWRPLEDDALAVVARGCIAGLAALHADRQLHRDVKPSNILLDWKWRVKLSDFGVSRAVDNTLGVAQTYVGTLAFMAPERIVGGDYSYASDLWSVGLCFATCALGKIPLPQADGYWAVVRAICDGDPPQLDPKDGHDAQLCDATNACLRRDASSRPTAQQLLDHPFVRRGQSIYAAAATERDRRAAQTTQSSPGRFGFPVWHLADEDGGNEAKKAQDLEALARKATAWRRTRPSSSQSSPHSSARSECRCDWTDDQLKALAAQLHTPVMEVKAAFEAGDEAALQLGGRPLPPSPRTPGPR